MWEESAESNMHFQGNVFQDLKEKKILDKDGKVDAPAHMVSQNYWYGSKRILQKE